MSLLKEADIEAVRSQSRIVDVVADHVTLKSAGAGRMSGLCPFHDERTPSFTVTTTNLFHCFGCQEGGDVISFVQKINHMSFRESVEFLAERFNIPLTLEDDGVPEAPSQRKQIMAINIATREFYSDRLLNGPEDLGRAYLKGRGYDPVTSAARFGSGWAPMSGTALVEHLRGLGFYNSDMIAAGVASEFRGRTLDVFVGRPTWAIADALKRTLGFGARHIRADDRREAKFINTAETEAYKKSSVLFGLDFASKSIGRSKQAVIVEGYMDVMAMHTAGIENAVATCGTALTADHLSVLHRLVGSEGEVVFVFDGDEAGRKAALKTYSTTKDAGIRRLSVVTIPEGKDPDDTLRTQGPEAVRALLEHKVPLIEATIRGSVAKLPTQTPEDRVVALDAILPLMEDIADGMLRGQYVELVAELLHLPADEVARKARTAPPVTRRTPGPSAPEVQPSAEVRNHAQGRMERDAIHLVVQYPELAVSFPDLLDATLFDNSLPRQVIPYLSKWVSSGSLSQAVLMAMLPDETHGAILPLALSPVLMEEGQENSYASEVIQRLTLAKMDTMIASLRRAAEGDIPDWDAINRIQEMRKSREELRVRYGQG